MLLGPAGQQNPILLDHAKSCWVWLSSQTQHQLEAIWVWLSSQTQQLLKAIWV
jgi:hypothetical protein